MAADAGNSRLDALNALLTSAHQLAQALESEPLVARVLETLALLPPDDRETIATALERGVHWRRVNESVAEANGVRLRANPNPRLFIRVVDGQEPPKALSPDPDDVLVGVLRVLRRGPVLATKGARVVWEPAMEEASRMLTPEERASCRAVARVTLRLFDRLIAELDENEKT